MAGAIIRRYAGSAELLALSRVHMRLKDDDRREQQAPNTLPRVTRHWWLSAETNAMCCSNRTTDAAIAMVPVVAHGTDCETPQAGFLVLVVRCVLQGHPTSLSTATRTALLQERILRRISGQWPSANFSYSAMDRRWWG